MADPLTILGAAGSVVQLIDFGWKLIGEANEIFEAGSTEENLDLTRLAQDSKKSSDILKQELASFNATSGTLELDDAAFFEAAQKASDIAADLLQLLTSLKLKEKGDGVEAVLAALRNARWKRRKENLIRRLTYSHQQLQTRLLVSTRNAALQHADHLAKSHAKLSEDIRGVSDGTSRIEDTVKAESTQIRNEQSYSQDALRDDIEIVRTLIEKVENNKRILDDPSAMSELRLQRVEDFILDKLWFPQIQEREDEIEPPHKQTFRWALSDSLETDGKFSNFKTWLRTGTASSASSIYWVAGKPASGKSTLMKFLTQQPEIYEAAKTWAGSKTLIFSSFYFYNQGTKDQKSQNGLLRTLLRTVLYQNRLLIPQVLPELFNLSAMRKSAVDLTFPQLRRAFAKMIEILPPDLNICFFIDGLDEYEGDPPPLLSLLTTISSPQVKLVLSSRTDPVYRNEFKKFPQLWLQYLTHGCIAAYVSDHFSGYSSKHGLSRRQSDEIQQLTHEIVKRSSGVFLWVMLVVRSLLRGLTNSDTINELKARLHKYPTELHKLYKHMMSRMESSYQVQASKYLQIVLKSTQVQDHHPLSLRQLWIIEQDRQTLQSFRELEWENDMEPYQKKLEVRLAGQCCGLVEVEPETKCVRFIHKSVADFLRLDEVWEHVVNLTGGASGFDPDRSLAMSCLLSLKGANPSGELDGQGDVGLLSEPRFVEYFLLYCREGERNRRTYLDLLTEFPKVLSVYTNTHEFGVIPSSFDMLPEVKLDTLTAQQAVLTVAACAGLRRSFHKLLTEDYQPEYLVSNGADVLSVVISHKVIWNAVLYKFLSDFEIVVSALLKNGAKPNAVSRGGQSVWTHLLQASYLLPGDCRVRLPYLRIVSMFLEKGAYGHKGNDNSILMKCEGYSWQQYLLMVAGMDSPASSIMRDFGYGSDALLAGENTKNSRVEFEELRQSVVNLLLQKEFEKEKRKLRARRILDKVKKRLRAVRKTSSDSGTM